MKDQIPYIALFCFLIFISTANAQVEANRSSGLCTSYGIELLPESDHLLVDLIKTYKGSNKWEEFLKQGSINYPGLFIDMIVVLIFFFIMALVVGFTFFGCFSAWFCTFIWRGCKDKYDVCEIPKRRGVNAWSMMVVNAAALYFIFSAIWGFFVFDEQFNRIDYNRCMIDSLIEEIAEGELNEKWKGMIPFIDTLDEIKAEVVNTTENYAELTGTDTLYLRVSNMEIKLDSAVYGVNQNLLVGTPNPVSTKAVRPIVIQNLGPVSDEDSWTGKVMVEINSKADVVHPSGDVIIDQVNIKRNTLDDIVEGLNSIQETLQDFGEFVEEYKSRSTAAQEDALLSEYQRYTLSYHIISISLAVLIMVTSCIAQTTNKSIFLHFTFVILLIYVMVTWIAGFAAIMATTFFMDSCDITYDLHTGDLLLEELSFFDRASVLPLQACFLGDSDFATAIGLSTVLEADLVIIEELEGLQPFIIDLVEKDTLIEFNETINSYKNLSVIAIEEEDEPDDNPDISLENFNKYSDYSAISCNKSRDHWVHSYTYCDEEYASNKFEEDDDYDKDLGSRICIDPTVASDTEAIKQFRYNNENFGSCVEDNAFFQNYQSILVAYYSAHKNYVITLLESMNQLQNSVNQFESDYDLYNTELRAFLDQFELITTQTEGLIKLLDDELEGFVPNSDCSFINGDLIRISNNTCNGLLPLWSELVIIYMVQLLFAVYASFKMFRLLKRFKRPRERGGKLRRGRTSIQTRVAKRLTMNKGQVTRLTNRMRTRVQANDDKSDEEEVKENDNDQEVQQSLMMGKESSQRVDFDEKSDKIVEKSAENEAQDPVELDEIKVNEREAEKDNNVD